MDEGIGLGKFAKEGLGLTAEELKNAVETDCDLMTLRVVGKPSCCGGSISP